MSRILFSILICLGATTAFGVEPFSLKIMNAEAGGQTMFNSADYSNGIYVVEGYFNNCPYCHTNAPKVNALSEKYAENENVKVLDVSYDCSTRYYADWISTHNPNHPVLNDCRGAKLLKPLGISSYPSVRILDCKLNVRYSHTNVWNDQIVEEIHNVIDELIEEDCSTLPTVEPFKLDIMNSIDDENKTFDSSKQEEGIFVVGGYFNDCPDCQDNAANIEGIATEFRENKEVFVLDVSKDCELEQYAEWIDTHKPSHPVLKDCNGSKLLTKLGFSIYPSLAILDCKHRVHYSHTGVWNDTTASEVRAVIEKIDGEECTTNPPIEPFELQIMNPEANSNETFRSSDNPEGVFVIEGYFYNCPYCHENAPNVEELSLEYKHEENLHVLDVGRDCSTRYYSRWIDEHSPTHPVLNDCEGKSLLTQLGISAYPTVKILDCNLKVRYSHLDVWDEVAKLEIRHTIDQLLEEGCVEP